MVRKIKGDGYRVRKEKVNSKDKIVQTIINKLHISEDVINGDEA